MNGPPGAIFRNAVYGGTKKAELIREVQRPRQMTKREQICETVRKTANGEIGMERYIEQ